MTSEEIENHLHEIFNSDPSGMKSSMPPVIHTGMVYSYARFLLIDIGMTIEKKYKQMKKVFFLLFFIGSLSIQSSWAQYKGQWTVSQGYEFQSDPGYLGFNLAAEYFPSHYFSLRPSYALYFPKSGKASGANLDARYFISEKNNQWYATAGYGYYQRNFELSDQSRTHLHFLNLGAGVNLKFLDQLGINPEINTQIGQSSRWTFRLGVVYFIN